MHLIAGFLFFALAILAIRGARWAYVGLMLFILLQFPASVGFQMHPRACYLAVNGPLALASLNNYPHMILFGIFFIITALHFHLAGWRWLALAIGVTVGMGAAMEIAQGLSGTHHCKAIDLIPDFIGGLIGLILLALGGAIARWRLNRLAGPAPGEP